MSAMSNSAYVQLVNLSKQFGKVRALAGLNVDIAEGELVALLGPSGCGKTTALRALAGLQDLDAGQIIVDGKDITFMAPNKRNMGMVFQAYSLFPHMTARENVEYGLRMKAHRTASAERTKRSGELLELVGLAWIDAIACVVVVHLVVLVIHVVAVTTGVLVGLESSRTLVAWDETRWSPSVGIAEPHIVMLDALIEVDMLHTTLAVHEHEAIVADELLHHRHEALVVHKVRGRGHSAVQVVLDEVPCI